jgi:hypothetical protein
MKKTIIALIFLTLSFTFVSAFNQNIIITDDSPIQLRSSSFIYQGTIYTENRPDVIYNQKNVEPRCAKCKPYQRTIYKENKPDVIYHQATVKSLCGNCRPFQRTIYTENRPDVIYNQKVILNKCTSC